MQRPLAGVRDHDDDQSSDLVSDEIFRNCHSRTQGTCTAAQSNKVAITFDDGPDPQWTPKILDVLKGKA